MFEISYSFIRYPAYTKNELINPRYRNFGALPVFQKELVPFYSEYLEKLENCIDINSYLLSCMTSNICNDWNIPLGNFHEEEQQDGDNVIKLGSLLLQISREWSIEGEKERMSSFSRIIDYLEKEIYSEYTKEEKNEIEILIPGLGLGRLMFELIMKGYKCQGNEINLHMVVTSHFFLNLVTENNKFDIYPYITRFNNKRSRDSQTRKVQVPDICPYELLNEDSTSSNQQNLMSVTIGSFIDIYGPNNSDQIFPLKFYNLNNWQTRQYNTRKFHCLISCFFLDTSPNILEYLVTINNTLKMNGYWINFGPLLWHFENDISLELTRQDLVEVIKKLGFKFIHQESGIETMYGADSDSIGGYLYKCDFWVLQKISDIL